MDGPIVPMTTPVTQQFTKNLFSVGFPTRTAGGLKAPYPTSSSTIKTFRANSIVQ